MTHFHNIYINNFSLEKNKESEKAILMYLTYHVGEDFLEISDGLRAIDEAILFCDMKRGSRLGHATVLGIDLDRYYGKVI